MEDIVQTRVIFKMTPPSDGEPECIAFLLDMDANPNCVLSYMHVGQHGEASRHYMNMCRYANREQYHDLKVELESMGYELEIGS